MIPIQYSIDRKKAANLLKVSVRTLDRYIFRNVISYVRKGARIFLSEDEIAKLYLLKNKKAQFESKGVKLEIGYKNKIDMDTPLSIDRESDSDDLDVNNGIIQRKSTMLINQHSGGYKELYKNALLELKENQKRLEGANYRVGNLEAKLEFYEKHFIPLAEHHKEAKQLKSAEVDLNTKYFTEKLNLNVLEKKLHLEKLNKQVVLGILFVILILQPILWVILK